MARIMVPSGYLVAGILLAGCLHTAPGLGGPGVAAQTATAAGTLEIQYIYLAPQETHPTYHTAIWLEDGQGRLVKTLFVSTELSATEYKMGEACPDWLKLVDWEKAAKTDVDAVTGATPPVGMGGMAFDLAQAGVPPGKYQFRFQVHITEQYNILYRGAVEVGQSGSTPPLEAVYGPGKLTTTEQFIRDVQLRYIPPAAS